MPHQSQPDGRPGADPRCNILFTSAGRRVGLVQSFRDALTGLGITGSIVTADLRSNAPAHQIADASELVPPIDDSTYVDRLLEICRAHAIHLVVPLLDPELPLLAEVRDAFAAQGVRLLVSSPETAAIGNDKRRTDAFFRGAGIATPELLDAQRLLSAGVDVAFPVLLKPAHGSASVGVSVVHDAEELRHALGRTVAPMVQQLVSGEEYTLDILIDFAGAVRCVVPRLRIETRAGEVSKGRTVKDPRIVAAGIHLGEALPGAVGCITAQCFLTPEGEILFIEINPRFGGGFPLAAAAGADFARWIVEWTLGAEPEIAMDGWQDGLTMLRYDAAFFVPGTATR